MKLEEAATFYRFATSLLEKVEAIAESIDADRTSRAQAAREAADHAKTLTNALETELHKAAGGRYWDATEARFKRAEVGRS